MKMLIKTTSLRILFFSFLYIVFPDFSLAQSDPVTDQNQQLVSNVFYETDLRQAIQDLSAQSGVTIIADNTVQGFVTMEINNLTLEQALNRILMVGGYSFRKIEDFYVVGAADPSNPAFNLVSRTDNIIINYISATEAAEQLSDFYKPFIKANDGTNTITVSASAEVIKRIKEDLRLIDAPPKQVMIEAIVTEIREGALKSVGIDWSLFWTHGSKSFDILNLLSPGIIDTLGPTISLGQKEIGTFGSGIPFDFVAKLQALAQDGKLNVRANPKLTTLNAKPANIYIAKEQYFSVVTGPVNYPYTKLEKVSVGIFLTITPFVSENDEITVQVETQVSDAVGTGREGLPLVDSRKVTTNVRVKNGETITIGGLSQYIIRETKNKIPILGSIPILGYLFSHTKYEKIKTDVLVLIKPTILVENWREN